MNDLSVKDFRTMDKEDLTLEVISARINAAQRELQRVRDEEKELLKIIQGLGVELLRRKL